MRSAAVLITDRENVVLTILQGGYVVPWIAACS